MSNKITWLEVLRHNLWQLLLHFDQGLGIVVCTVLKERAWSDITLSAQAYLWEQTGVRSWTRKAIDLLFFCEKDHCKASYEYEVERRHLPPEMR